MKAYFLVLLASALLVVAAFGYQKYSGKLWRKEAAPTAEFTSPEARAADLQLKINILRADLWNELQTFERSFEFANNGFGAGPKFPYYKYTREEPEAEWIASTKHPKLRRARELQREIWREKAELFQARAQM